MLCSRILCSNVKGHVPNLFVFEEMTSRCLEESLDFGNSIKFCQTNLWVFQRSQGVYFHLNVMVTHGRHNMGRHTETKSKDNIQKIPDDG